MKNLERLKVFFSVCSMDTLLISDPQTNQLKQRLIVCGHSNGLLDLYITDLQSNGTNLTNINKQLTSTISTTTMFGFINLMTLAEKPHAGTKYLLSAAIT